MLGWVGLGVLGVGALAIGAWVYVVQNVEQPKYRSVLVDGDFELRDYPSLVIAEVAQAGGRWAAANAAFPSLARYIFARERDGEKIAMTAPVVQQDAAADAASDPGRRLWRVQFIMPSAYRLDDLPAPANQNVRIFETPASRRASVRFSGFAADESVAEQEARLRAWMDAQGLSPVEPPIYAYYNDPMTPGFLRRNEVMFVVTE